MLAGRDPLECSVCDSPPSRTRTVGLLMLPPCSSISLIAAQVPRPATIRSSAQTRPWSDGRRARAPGGTTASASIATINAVPGDIALIGLGRLVSANWLEMNSKSFDAASPPTHRSPGSSARTAPPPPAPSRQHNDRDQGDRAGGDRRGRSPRIDAIIRSRAWPAASAASCSVRLAASAVLLTFSCAAVFVASTLRFAALTSVCRRAPRPYRPAPRGFARSRPRSARHRAARVVPLLRRRPPSPRASSPVARSSHWSSSQPSRASFTPAFAASMSCFVLSIAPLGTVVRPPHICRLPVNASTPATAA